MRTDGGVAAAGWVGAPRSRGWARRGHRCGHQRQPCACRSAEALRSYRAEQGWWGAGGGHLGGRRGPRATAAGGPPKLACSKTRSQARAEGRKSAGGTLAPPTPPLLLGVGGAPPPAKSASKAWRGLATREQPAGNGACEWTRPPPRTPLPSRTAVSRLGLPAQVWPTRLRGRPAGAPVRKATRRAGLSSGLESTIRQGSARGDLPNHFPLATLLPE